MTVDALLTASEAAALLRLDVRRVQTLARSGRLPGVRAGRKWLFPRQALLDALRGPGTRTPSPAAPSGAAVTPASTAGVEISARNQLRGRVARLVVDGLMAEVEIAVGDQRLVSVITRSAAERLQLREGQEVLAVIKSTEIMVARDAASAAPPAVDPASS